MPSSHDDLKTIKIPMGSVVKNQQVLDSMNEVVIRVHEINIRVLQFLQLYLIACQGDIPLITEDFLTQIGSVVTTPNINPNRNKNPILNDLIMFYRYHFPTTMIKPSRLGIKNILTFSYRTIVTAIENNVKLHYKQHLQRYVETVYEKKKLISKCKTKKERRLVTRKLKAVNNYFFDQTESKLLSRKDEDWCDDTYMNMFCKDHIDNMSDKGLCYDVKVRPQAYLYSMYYMAYGVQERKCKSLSILPLKRTVIPGHIMLDTKAVYDCFLTTDQRSVIIERTKEQNGYKKTKSGNYVLKGLISNNHKLIWSSVLNFEHKLLKEKKDKDGNIIPPKLDFNFSIHTDAVTCSLQFDTGSYNTRFTKNEDKKHLRTVANEKNEDRMYSEDGTPYYQYGDEVDENNIVGIDPGTSDLLFCFNLAGEIMTYSQNQRRFEKKTKRYRDIRKKLTEGIKIYEIELSKFNSRSVDFGQFKRYIHAHFVYYEAVKETYRLPDFRKLKYLSFVNTRRSEQNMITRFKKTFGDNATVCIGNYSRDFHMKNKEPCKGVGFRRLFEKYGHKVYLVDEFRTSKMCTRCKCEKGTNDKFVKKLSPKPWIHTNKKWFVHGLLKCNKCGVNWNRDYNGARNILNICLSKERPEYLCRQENNK